MNFRHISMSVRRTCAIFALALSGCVSFTGVEEPGDALVDEANAPFARQAEEVYKARRSFKRKVAIVEGEGVDAFLAKAKWGKNSQIPKAFKNAEELCSHYEVRRALLLEARRGIVQWLGTLRDFELVNRDPPTMQIGTGLEPAGAMIEFTTGNSPSPIVELGEDVYRLFYGISSVSLDEKGCIETKKDGRTVIERRYSAKIHVELNLVAPDDKIVFSFYGTGESEKGLFEKRWVEDGTLDVSLLPAAVSMAVRDATQRYAQKFAPPLYVEATCQNGQFAKLNAGSEYGLVAGTKVRFFGHRTETAQDGSETVKEYYLGTGIVGCEKNLGQMRPKSAMMGRGSVWVLVNDFDEKQRRVFKWSSARAE